MCVNFPSSDLMLYFMLKREFYPTLLHEELCSDISDTYEKRYTTYYECLNTQNVIKNISWSVFQYSRFSANSLTFTPTFPRWFIKQSLNVYKVCSKNTRTVWIARLQLVSGESAWCRHVRTDQPIKMPFSGRRYFHLLISYTVLSKRCFFFVCRICLTAWRSNELQWNFV